MCVCVCVLLKYYGLHGRNFSEDLFICFNYYTYCVHYNVVWYLLFPLNEVAMLNCTYPSIMYVRNLIPRATSLLEECGGPGSFSHVGDVKVRKVVERT